MQPKVLYVLTKETVDPLLSTAPSEQHTSVVLVQDAVLLHDIPGDDLYFLTDDADARHVHPPAKGISYQDFLHLMFDADRVVAL